jgi:hypothetical protein
MHETPLRGGDDHQIAGTKTTQSPTTCGGFGPSSWSKESKSFSNAERDPEISASYRSVAKLRRPSHDRLREPLDWNESNPRKVDAAPDEVAPEADSTSILAADAWIDKLSRSSTNLSRSLRGSTVGVFGFMSMRNR